MEYRWMSCIIVDHQRGDEYIVYKWYTNRLSDNQFFQFIDMAVIMICRNIIICCVDEQIF